MWNGRSLGRLTGALLVLRLLFGDAVGLIEPTPEID